MPFNMSDVCVFHQTISKYCTLLMSNLLSCYHEHSYFHSMISERLPTFSDPVDPPTISWYVFNTVIERWFLISGKVEKILKLQKIDTMSQSRDDVTAWMSMNKSDIPSYEVWFLFWQLLFTLRTDTWKSLFAVITPKIVADSSASGVWTVEEKTYQLFLFWRCV